tara:strand:+ start:1438 stop:1806 length:369 start_codon:yes stop_codon:yes gene_type:complete
MNKQFVFTELSITQQKASNSTQNSKFLKTKIWHFFQKKYKRIFKKQESLYNNEKIEDTHSDTESDRTDNEKKRRSNRRNYNSSRSSDKTTITNYDKRDSSLDIIRNDENNYEIVLPYQRIVK